MILVILYFFFIVLAWTNSEDRNRNANTVAAVLLGAFACAFLNFVFTNIFAHEVKTFTPITSPIVREVVNNEVVLTFTTSDNKKWSLPGDTPSEVGYRDSLVNNDSVSPSMWVSLMDPTIPDYKSLLVAP